MRTRAAVVLALSSLSLVAGPALAAPKKLPKAVPMSWTDQAKDANAINSQGDLLPVDQTATPADVAGADILGVTISRVDNGTTVSAVKVTLKLSGPPQSSVIYRVTGSAPGCSTFWFQYANYADGATSALRNNCAPSSSPTSAVSSTVSGPVSAAVIGNSIVWTLRVKEFPSRVKLGTVFSPKQAESRAILGAGAAASATVPVLDETAIQTRKYTFGQ